MTKTIRLMIPDWQAGANRIYQLGAQILAAIAPQNDQQPLIKIPVDNNQQVAIENGVVAQSVILETLQRTKQTILKERPDKIITLGGNCLVSQEPIDYLNGHYNDHLGVIWVDAHPDISTPAVFNHEHAMVVGNLLHHGDPKAAKIVEHPLQANQIYYLGLSDPTCDEQQLLTEAGITYRLQTGNSLNIDDLAKWIVANQYTHFYIHLDVDILNPEPRNFYDTYFNNPQLHDLPDNAAVGKTQLDSVWNFVKRFSNDYNLVGLTIAEYMPWGAQALVNLMNDTKIF